ncbi:hypothetical protein C1645_820923 [Glomus cerebriforme]|uniref:F-box domain-containing protein n=1 Tax=Glomus cerebriforme TaxID=658196 RepID=A0A397T1P2_9GLOM|nr:hypothetical protein C1645_820923 [Glomus cerebriforme]
MFKLNRDILYLIFEELQDDKNTLYSCLSVNKTWSEIIVPILWKDPWKYSKWGNDKLLLNIIISHLSDKSKNGLKDQGIDFLTNSYQKPLFNYIRFCRRLNLIAIDRIIDTIIYIYSKSKILIIKNEIYNLFINENTKFTHLYMPNKFDHQIHLISGAKHCFADIEFFSCNTSINDNVLTGLLEICNSIKELELFIEVTDNNYEIVKLIKAQKKLSKIHFLTNYSISPKSDESFCIILENSLIKHANTIRYFKITKPPITSMLSSFVNLITLELDDDYGNFRDITWLENLSLPFLQILRASRVQIKALTSLIGNTNGSLIEIKIDYVSHDEINNKKLIQVIYQNCPNLEYLKLVFRNSNILELENLLIKCQHLNELFFIISDLLTFNWETLFIILTKSSPISLFKFEFDFFELPKLNSLKLFFDNWKGRHPMLLQFCRINKELSDLIEIYKSEGIVKQYNNDYSLENCENYDNYEENCW